MRFYTVPDAREARKSVFVATGFIGYFYILTFTIGYGAAALVNASYLKKPTEGGLGSNMAAPVLADILGGGPFLGFLCAVAFATILAVVAGLTLAGASALSHDLYAGVIRQGRSKPEDEVKVARGATIGLGILAVLLGLLFKDVNVAFMVGLAFAVAASANFPALLLSILWSRFTTNGAVVSMATGLIVAVVLIILSPTVWVDVFQATVPKAEQSLAPFPWKNPALISMTASFVAGIIVSLMKPEPEAEAKFESEKLRTLSVLAPNRTSESILQRMTTKKWFPRFLLSGLLAFTALPAASAPSNYRTRFIKNARRNQYTAITNYPIFRGKGAVIRLANSQLAHFARAEHSAFLKEARQIIRQGWKTGGLDHNLQFQASDFQRPSLISVSYNKIQYLAGAHGMNWTICFNFGKANGRARRLTLGDFFKNDKEYQKRVSQVAIQKLRQKGAAWVIDGTAKSLSVEQLNRFTVEKDGLRFYFDPYEMGPYAVGSYDVKLTLKELGAGFHIPL
jgi:hypothetical protein